jgi:hypothetical protein
MRLLLRSLAVVVTISAMWLMGGCSGTYDPYYYGSYDNGYYYHDRPVSVYYYHSRDPFYHRYHPYYHRAEVRHDGGRGVIEGRVHVRD